MQQNDRKPFYAHIEVLRKLYDEIIEEIAYVDRECLLLSNEKNLFQVGIPRSCK